MNAKTSTRRRKEALAAPTKRGATLRSIGRIARLQRVSDNDADYVAPLDILAELRREPLC